MATEILVPELGESVVEATVGRWLKQEGDPVTVGETLVDLETDKVNLEVSATQSGILARIKRQEGEDVKIGDTLGVIEGAETLSDGAEALSDGAEALSDVPAVRADTDTVAESEVASASEDPRAPQAGIQAPEERVTPVARRMAQEEGVDLTSVRGTGTGGRVTKQDIEHIIEKQHPGEPDPEPETGPAPPLAQETAAGEREEVIRMSRRRRTIAQRLVDVQHTAAMLTTFNEIDMSAVIDIRSRQRDAFEKRHGVKLGFMSFFVKAAVGALKAFPPVNAEIRDDTFVIKHYYDIGMAIGAEEGLVVPVLRDADCMTFAGIEKAIMAYVEKVKSGTLSVDDLRGGTFTITNGGVFGSLLSTPILNPPQVGILGLHKIEERPIALDGQVVIRPMMYVALSYDHRIIDGREAVQFLVRLKELIEDPSGLLLEG